MGSIFQNMQKMTASPNMGQHRPSEPCLRSRPALPSIAKHRSESRSIAQHHQRFLVGTLKPGSQQRYAAWVKLLFFSCEQCECYNILKLGLWWCLHGLCNVVQLFGIFG
eukprot:EG_transcript_15787